MIPGGQDIDVATVQLFDDLRGDAESGRRIFAIGDDEIDPAFLDDPGESSRTARLPGLPTISPIKSIFMAGRPIAQNRRPSSPG